MKQLVWKPHPRGWGIDVGWRVTDRDGVTVTIRWGNCKDESQLPKLIAEELGRGGEVEAEPVRLDGEWRINPPKQRPTRA